MRAAHDPARFVVVSEWSSMAEFATWEQGASHRSTTSPLRPLQDPQLRPVIYEEVAAYGATGALADATR
jgi:heme-degrading monooxygenase HmoA